jgi:hypothetical protein
MDIKQEWKKRFTWIVLLVLTPAVLFAGLNFQQLISAWTVSNETRQLERRAALAPEGVENPAPLTEDFEDGLSTAFWDFTIINGAGQASNETAWHAAELEIDYQLTLRHVQDPEFETESSDWQEPSSGQYKNVTLNGSSGSNCKVGHRSYA